MTDSARAVLRNSSKDYLLVAFAILHGVMLLVAPSALLIALALWWTANTVAHNFLHLPFFVSRAANRVFSGYLTLLLGLPQTLWRDRHLAHHADLPWRMRWSRQMYVELVLSLAVWTLMALRGSEFFFLVWLPGWLIGLVLCQLQGYFEHVRGTVSHYGVVYNSLFFNDGYHREHHDRPTLHWTQLPRVARADERPSRWPPVLRWLELSPLCFLEGLALRSSSAQRWLLHLHEQAILRLFRTAHPPQSGRIVVVGGGLFPRSAIVLRRILPGASVEVLDYSAENLSRASALMPPGVKVTNASYSPELVRDADLVVFPLAFNGDRWQLYENPPASLVLVHDWIWRRRGTTTAVSWFLLKRLNLVTR